MSHYEKGFGNDVPHVEFYLCVLHTIGSVHAKLYKIFFPQKTYHAHADYLGS